MIKKNDVLKFKTFLEDGDENALFLALEDEEKPSNTSFVKVVQVNSGLSFPCSTFFESENYKVIGKAFENESFDSIIERFKNL